MNYISKSFKTAVHTTYSYGIAWLNYKQLYSLVFPLCPRSSPHSLDGIYDQ